MTNFNDFFIVPILASKMRSVFFSCLHYMPTPSNISVCLYKVTEDEIHKIIITSNKEAAAHDAVIISVLTMIMNSVYQPMIHLCNSFCFKLF